MKKKILFFAVFAFCLLLIVPATHILGQDNSKDVLPPDILPIVILKGSDYEMGYQYGQQAGHLIEKAKEEAWASALRQYSYEEIMKGLKANQYYIRKYTPEAITIMKGIADGAMAAGFDVTYEDEVLLNCDLPNPETSTVPEGAEKESLPPKKCSVCSAWGSTTKDGKLIGMDTLDGGRAYYGVLIVAFPETGNSYMCGAKAGTIGSHFLMNNKGLFIGNSGGGGSPRKIDYNYGIAWFCSLPHMVRFTDNAIQAKDMLLPWHIDLPENFHLVDTKGNAFVVEKTAAIQSVREPGDFGETDFLYSTNNYLNDKMKPTKKGEFVKKHGGYGEYAAPRNLMLWDMLHNYQGKVDVEFVKMMLRFPGEPPPYPPEGGWDAKICRPSNSWVSVLIPDDGNNGYAYICTGPAGKVIHSSEAHNGRIMKSNYMFINGTHTFYKITLDENPMEVTVNTRKDASDCIAKAYKELMYLNYTDTGYAKLNEIYNLANKEYYKGLSAMSKSVLAKGNESISYLSEAATFFTRAQAHAMQVYEALISPPTSPSDLGLKPFGGDWAEWETKVGSTK